MRRVAAFVDAGYFWVQVAQIIHGSKESRGSVFIDYGILHDQLIIQITDHFPNCDLLRIYWYDGPGQHGKTPDHTSIERLDDFKLRLGTRNGVGEQKAVDGLIIADMIGLSQQKSITDALLISGDADLTPGVIATQSLGIRVHLLSLGPDSATSPYLKVEVDKHKRWGDDCIVSFARANSLSAGSSVFTDSAHAFSLPYSLATLHESVRQFYFCLTLDKQKCIPKSGAIPRDVDIELLKCFSGHPARSLDERDKRSIRNALRNVSVTSV